MNNSKKSNENIGIRYLKETCFDRLSIRHRINRETVESTPFKKYPDASKISLPRNWDLYEEKITSLLQNRRSLRKYSKSSITLDELAFMLWASQGVTAQAGKYLFRTSPSGGALYPVETYLSIHRVAGVQAGLYHFDPELFELEKLTEYSIGEVLSDACLGQKFIATSAVTFIWSAVLYRNMNKYGSRGLRYILLDAGHICQNVLLSAEAIGCGGCPVGAFYDDDLNSILDLDGEKESVLYLASIGKKPIQD